MVQRVRGRATGNEVNRAVREQITKDLVFKLENSAITEFCQSYTAISCKMQHDLCTVKRKIKLYAGVY